MCQGGKKKKKAKEQCIQKQKEKHTHSHISWLRDVSIKAKQNRTKKTKNKKQCRAFGHALGHKLCQKAYIRTRGPLYSLRWAQAAVRYWTSLFGSLQANFYLCLFFLMENLLHTLAKITCLVQFSLVWNVFHPNCKLNNKDKIKWR